MAKTVHSVTGQSPVVAGRGSVLFYVTFSGTGSAQLQAEFDGDWVPVSTSYTSSMSVIEAASFQTEEPVYYRWNVTVGSGTITTYVGV